MARSNKPDEASLEVLLVYTKQSKFRLVTLAAKRARQINAYFNQLGEELGPIVPPQVSSVSRTPLSVAFDEIAAGKIRVAQPLDQGLFDAASGIADGNDVIVWISESDMASLERIRIALEEVVNLVDGRLEIVELQEGSLRALFSPYQSRKPKPEELKAEYAARIDPIAGIDPSAAVAFADAVARLLTSIQQSVGRVMMYTSDVLILHDGDGTRVASVPPAQRDDVGHRVNGGDWDGLLERFGGDIAA